MRARVALPAGVLLALPLAFLASCGHSSEGPPVAGIPGLADLARPGETVLFARRFPAGPPAAGAAEPSWGLVAVVRMGDGHEEMRVAEPRGDAFAQVHASRPGDEFRNLVIEDINADAHPEIVSRWAGGQLEVVEVLGRLPEGGWQSLLQNAGQVIEERRRADGTVAFWVTSRTYEEEAGLPPVYETRVWRWDGKAYAEAPR